MHTQQPTKQRGPAAFSPKKVGTGEFALTPIKMEFQRIADAALFAADNLLADWLSDGKRKGKGKGKGKEYWASNPVRGDQTPGSFSINLHTGKWHDFASGEKGVDLVSLLAYPINTQHITLTEDHGRPHHGLVYYFGAEANSNIAACNERDAIQSGV